MADENTPNDQVSNGDAPQDGNQANGEQGGGQAPRTYDEAYVKQLRDEAAGYRTKLRDAERAKMTDDEKVKAELAELREYRETTEREKRDRAFADAVTDAARKAGALYPERIYRVLDVERNDDGTPKNLDAAIKALKADMPALFAVNGGKGSADAGAGNKGNDNGGGMNAIIRRAAGRTAL